MINKKKSQSEMRMAALKKENLRLQRKIYTLEAKNTTLQNELLLRPPYEEPKTYPPVTVEDVNKYLHRHGHKGPNKARACVKSPAWGE